jgi:tRNA(adenine34) deaminase
MGMTPLIMQASDIFWMEHALLCAAKAKAQSEVPIGAVIVKDNQLIAEGWNQPISRHDPSSHAEIVAIRAAAQLLKNYRLIGCTLYVTLEPCAMCMGAIMHARIQKVIFGAFDLKENFTCNHHAEVRGGILQEECAQVLKSFFQSRR